jgi:phenylpropionate dioxygenase-like ring-hydroxylating dioxygenase large terminal subunit
MATALKAPTYRDSTAPIYQDIIAADIVTAPAIMRDYSETNVPVASVSRDEYRSPAFAAREREQMWSRVWQMACREEQIPEVGDVVVYDSPGASFLIVRAADDDIRAYYNSCRHRGMKLCTGDTSVNKLTCPFHGFTWNLDGSLAHVPSRWDFPGLQDETTALAQVKVGRWGGFIFINRAENPPPLEEYLGHLVPHFADWPYDKLYLATAIRKPMDANWKTSVEAFLEAYHLAGVHAQALPFSGESSTQYDVWADDPHVSRFLEPTGIVSDQYPHVLSEQQILNSVMEVIFANGEPVALPEGAKARTFLAAGMRAEMNKVTGADYTGLSDTEAGDAIQYYLFPNIVIFRSLPYPFVYRFLPHRDDPNKSMFEFLVFRPKPGDGSAPPEVNVVELGEDGTFAGSGVLPPWQGEIYDQDVDGLRMCQEGMRDGGDTEIIFSRYQEVRIRHLHQTLHRYLDGDI